MSNQRQTQKHQRRNSKAESSSDYNSVVYSKVVPHATDLEMAVLGSIIAEPDSLFTISDFLSEQCFYREAHQILFRVFTSMHNERRPIELATVLEELKKCGELETIGGSYYLSQLIGSITNTGRNPEYCRIIQQKFMRRELIKNAGEILAAAYDETQDEFELLEDAEQRIFGISQHHAPAEMQAMDSVIMETAKLIESNRLLKDNGGITGVPTGFHEINIATRGWQPGDLIILAARPSVGKTAAALKIVRTAAHNDIKKVAVALFSLEMQAIKLALRMVAAESKVLLHKLQSGNIDDQEMKRLYSGALSHLAKQKIFIDDQPGLTHAKLRNKCRRLKSKHDIGLIVIDYLQLMSGGTGKNMNREQEIATISRSLKTLAMELKIPIIALSQMSRDIEKRPSKMPQLSDLRESGSIEQDADLVMFLYGPFDDEAEDKSNYSRRFIKIAKQRDGMLITTEVVFQNTIQEFEELEEVRPAPPSSLPQGGNWRPVPTSYQDPSQPKSKDDLPF